MTNWVARHRILLLLSLAGALQGLASTSYHQILLDIKQTFDSSWALVAATISVFSLVTALARLLVGPLIDRVGEGRVVVPCLVIFGAGALVGAGAPSVAGLALGIAIQALGIAPLSIVTSTLIAARYGEAERGKILGLSQTVSWVGPMLGPLLGSYLTVLVGWRSIFLAHLVAAVPLALGLLFVQSHLTAPSRGEKPAPRQGDAVKFDLIAISLLGAVHFFALFAVQALLPLIVRSHLGLDARFAGWISLLLSVISMVIFPWGGRLADRIGGRMAALWGMSSLFLALGVLTATIMGDIGVRGVLLLAVGVILLGGASGLTLPAHLKEIVERYPQARASALGTYKMLQYLGGTAGPALLGLVMAVLGPGWILAMIFGVSAVVSVPMAAAMLPKHYDPKEFPWLEERPPLMRQRTFYTTRIR